MHSNYCMYKKISWFDPQNFMLKIIILCHVKATLLKPITHQ